MSPNINSFVGDLVAMAQAMETLPKVQEELSEAHARLDAQQATIQRLELKLIERANQIDSLHGSLRKAEADRDDAELRFLEADETLSTVRRALGVATPVPMAEVKAEVQPPFTSTESPVATDADPLPGGVATSDTPMSATQSPSVGEPSQREADATQGQREPDPTTVHTQDSIGSSSATSAETAGPSSTEGQSANPPTALSSSADPSPGVGGDAKADASGMALTEPVKYSVNEFGDKIITGQWWSWRSEWIKAGHTDPLDF